MKSPTKSESKPEILHLRITAIGHPREEIEQVLETFSNRYILDPEVGRLLDLSIYGRKYQDENGTLQIFSFYYYPTHWGLTQYQSLKGILRIPLIIFIGTTRGSLYYIKNIRNLYSKEQNFNALTMSHVPGLFICLTGIRDEVERKGERWSLVRTTLEERLSEVKEWGFPYIEWTYPFQKAMIDHDIVTYIVKPFRYLVDLIMNDQYDLTFSEDYPEDYKFSF